MSYTVPKIDQKLKFVDNKSMETPSSPRKFTNLFQFANSKFPVHFLKVSRIFQRKLKEKKQIYWQLNIPLLICEVSCINIVK